MHIDGVTMAADITGDKKLQLGHKYCLQSLKCDCTIKRESRIILRSI